MADTIAYQCAAAAVAAIKAAVTSINESHVELGALDPGPPLEMLPRIVVQLGDESPEFTDTIHRVEERLRFDVLIAVSSVDVYPLQLCEDLRHQAHSAIMADQTLGGIAGAIDYQGTLREYPTAETKLVVATLQYEVRITRDTASLTQ